MLLWHETCVNCEQGQIIEVEFWIEVSTVLI